MSTKTPMSVVVKKNSNVSLGRLGQEKLQCQLRSRKTQISVEVKKYTSVSWGKKNSNVSWGKKNSNASWGQEKTPMLIEVKKNSSVSWGQETFQCQFISRNSPMLVEAKKTPMVQRGCLYRTTNSFYGDFSWTEHLLVSLIMGLGRLSMPLTNNIFVPWNNFIRNLYHCFHLRPYSFL